MGGRRRIRGCRSNSRATNNAEEVISQLFFMFIVGREGFRGTTTYIEPAPLNLILEDQHGERRQQQRAKETRGAHFPRKLALPRPREDPLHQPDNVERRQDVKDLEDNIVDVLAAIEDIGIS